MKQIKNPACLALALLCLVPGVGMIIVLCILAFGTWPNERR